MAKNPFRIHGENLQNDASFYLVRGVVIDLKHKHWEFNALSHFKDFENIQPQNSPVENQDWSINICEQKELTYTRTQQEMRLPQ